MAQRTRRIGRLVAVTALFAGPAVAAFVVLAGTGALAPHAALVGGLIAAAGALAATAFFGRDAVRLSEHLERLSRFDGPPPPVPELHSKLGRMLLGRVAALDRDWRARDRAQAVRIEAIGAVVDSLDDPVLVLDLRRIVVRANGAAVTMLGGDPVGRDLAAVLRPPQVLAAVDAVLGGAGRRTIEFTRPVPVEQVFEARIKPFGDGVPSAPNGATGAGPGIGGPSTRGTTGEPAALLTLHDITAVKRAEQMRADFVANASHELRTPLATLAGFIETLRGPAHDDPEARDRFLGIMGEQAARMSRLVNDLMSLSRIELDEHTAPNGHVDAPALLRSVIDTFELKAERRRMRLVLDAEAGLPAVIGDSDQLTQVFQNLVDNAIKYSRPDSAITISIRRAQVAARCPGVAVAVSDQGDGIPREHLPRLTERFYRVDPARSRAMGGTGLGLAIVKHIVSRHRGRLAIDSELGRGSTFSVTLRAVKEGPPPVRVEAAVAEDIH